MASYNKYHCFVEDLGNGVHDLSNDTLKIALTNTAPNAATHADLGDITEISAGSGYAAGGEVIDNTVYSQTGGVAKLVGDDVVFTADGGPIGPFRYAVIYNDDAANDELIAWFEYPGGSITLLDGETLTINLDQSGGIFTVT